MPVLVSHLLPQARGEDVNDPATREGFLRVGLQRAAGDNRRRLIASEMTRTPDVQWPFLSARFSAETSASPWERIGILSTLAAAPHTVEKLATLVSFLDDTRNEGILTQRDGPAAESLVRRNAISALLEFRVAGAASLPDDLEKDLSRPGGQAAALLELRRVAREWLSARRSAVR
jgi:hypothetical protein